LAHKKHKRKFLNILLIPDDESSPKTIRIRYTVLSLVLVFIIFIFVGLLVIILTYGQLMEKAYENIRLTQENEKLREQVQKINELATELNNLKRYGEKIQNRLTGFVKISDVAQEGADEKTPVIANDETLISIYNSIPLKAPVNGFISQEYKKSQHSGLDIVAPIGTPIVAAASGTVLYSDWTGDGGNTIIIGHDFGYYTYYKHNLRNVVQVNERVEQGQVIGYLGNSGLKSYGPHLHFEIWKDGKSIDPRMLIAEYQE